MAIWDTLPVHVWLEIFKNLPYNDLQQVRLVCKDWKDIADMPELSRRSKLKIMDNNVMLMVYFLKENYKYQQLFPFARNVHISIELIERNRAWLDLVLLNVGPSIESLSVVQLNVLKSLPSKGLPGLKELSVLQCCGNTSINSDLEFDYQKHLKLQCLELNNLGTVEQSSLLSSLLKTGNLLKIRKLRLQITESSMEEIILNVLRAYGKNLTMVHLTFNSKPAPSFNSDAWGKAFSQMPKLEHIGLFGQCSSYFLKVVLSSIPETVPMKNIDVSGTYSLADHHVKYMLNKWSKSLKFLDFMFCPEMSHSGFQYLTCVKDNLRSLNLSYCHYAKRSVLMEALCSLNNNVLRNLYLNYMGYLDEELLCCLAQRYTNLKVLTLNNCNKAVTDYSLGLIFEHMQYLQRLEINDCNLITDSGLLGTPDRPYPITRLRWLQTLSMISSGRITNASFRTLKFPYLREFRFGYSRNISSTNIKKFIENCPALEVLFMTSCYYLDDSVVKHIHKKLKRLTELNIMNCPKITPMSIEYLKCCTLLRELSISGQNRNHANMMKTSWVSALGDRKIINCRVLDFIDLHECEIISMLS